MSKSLLVVFVLLTLILGTPALAENNKNQNPSRLKICQARENTLKNRSQKIVNMGDAMLANFDLKVQRIQNYYTTNLVSKNIIVPNYGNLVTDIQTKKTAVQTLLAKARAESVTFTCDSTDPQKSLRDFRTYMQSVNSALKDYRVAVKNLIVAVRTAANSVEKS